MSAVGFAVAGGASSRMGRDKALLPWGASDLLGHALARLGAVVPEVRILCGRAPRYAGRGFALDVDPQPGLGPAGGLLAALEVARGRAALLLAVDLPFVTTSLLSRLVALAPGWDAVVPISPCGREPLCAVYGPACLPALRRRLASGEQAMTSFWPEVRVCQVPAAELADADEAGRLFTNVNSPADYRAAHGRALR